MPDNRKRLLILAGVAALLAAVLAYQHLLPRGDDSLAQTPGMAPAKAQDQGQPPPAASGAPAAPEADMPYTKLFTLSQQPTPQDVPVLKKAIQSPSWEDRHAAVVGLGRLKDKGDPATLLAVLTNTQEKAEVRAEAAEQLGAMKYADAGPAIIDAMSDESVLVRIAAGTAISTIMGMRFNFSARDPADKREEAISLTRKYWPIVYPDLQRKQKRGG